LALGFFLQDAQKKAGFEESSRKDLSFCSLELLYPEEANTQITYCLLNYRPPQYASFFAMLGEGFYPSPQW
jgi:hypothetical protein